jgi:leukotriene-A4 hydrolase
LFISLLDRSHVWSEKEFVEQAAFDFSETEAMLAIAEELCGPYVWGEYDILVLPPSFPYGGMENPCLTFATPTLLSGDKVRCARHFS